jgi:hypothetical protein
MRVPTRRSWKVSLLSRVLWILHKHADWGGADGGSARRSGDGVVALGTRGDQAELRALNERMWEVNLAFWEASGVFCVACECADPACASTVQITPQAYEAARRGTHTFVLARDHAGADVERVVAEGEGYVLAELDTRGGAAAVGEQVAVDFASQHFRVLVAELLDTLPEDGRELALRHAGERFGHRLAGRAQLRAEADLAAGLERVCAAVRALGYHAVLREVDGDTAVIDTPTCPLRPLVSERVDAVEIDRGMWTGLVEHGVRDLVAEHVACETHSCLERGEPCVVTLRFGERADVTKAE